MSNPPPKTKVLVTLPTSVVAQADRIRRRSGATRSTYIAQLIVADGDRLHDVLKDDDTPLPDDEDADDEEGEDAA